ncbi:hypothetical protein DY000_02052295 [Brassica cretica]|uniref:Aspartic peptidase DDI1-type domain-containing protein n=2 Tax=Brassica cretica TaxID=69181 RepID=A0ABQ7A6M9_BRACR|nr:hypothetical protein DY000_02052295 [Brassica cretica]
MPYRVCLPNLDAYPLNATRDPYQTSVCLGTTEKICQQPEDAPEQEQSTLAETSLVEIDQRQWDGYEPVMEVQATNEGLQLEKKFQSRKPFILKHLRREANKVELDGFQKRVKRVPKDMSFEDAYYKYRFSNFFRESTETDKDIEMLFNNVRYKPKRTLQKEQDPGKFLIPCCILDHTLPNALCDTGSAVSIMVIDTADLLGLKMEPSQDSFTFVDNSMANSAGMIKNVKVEIGDCSIPVDFHVMKSKSGQTSSLLFGRAFMATVGAVCDLKKNRMCLTNVDETVFYDPVEKKKNERFISCIDVFEDPTLTTNKYREPARPASASIDIQPPESIDNTSSTSIDSTVPASIDTNPCYRLTLILESSSCPHDIADSTQKSDREVTLEDFLELEEWLREKLDDDRHPSSIINRHPWLDELPGYTVEIESIEERMHKSETSHFSIHKHQRPCEVGGLGYRGYFDKAPAEALSNDANDQTTSIDSITSPSIDTNRILEQTEYEVCQNLFDGDTTTRSGKSGGRKNNRKKKNKRNADADSLSVVPLQCQEGSLEYRVRCREGSESFTKSITSIDRSPLNCVDRQSFKSIDRHLTVVVDTNIKVRRVRFIGMDGDIPTVRLSPSFDTRYRFELAFQCHRFEVNQHHVAEVMPVLLRSGQSASQHEAVEKRNACRSMQSS